MSRGLPVQQRTIRRRPKQGSQSDSVSNESPLLRHKQLSQGASRGSTPEYAKQPAQSAPSDATHPDRFVYIETLRCCLMPVLDAGVDKGAAKSPNTAGSPGTGSGAVESGSKPSSHFNAVLLATGYLPANAVTQAGSVEKGDTIQLGAATLKTFRKLLQARVEIFLSAMKDPRTRTFAKAGSRMLRERMHDSSNLALFADVRDLILVLGAYIHKELDAGLSPEDHDNYLLLTSELFLAVLREAIQKAEPRSTVMNCPILKDQAQLRVVLKSFIKHTPISGNSLESNLADWARVVFEVTKDEHQRVIADVRRTCNERSTFASLKAHLDSIIKNECPGSRPSDFQYREAYEAWKHRETQLLQVILQTFMQRFPNAAKLSTAGGSRVGGGVDPANPRLCYSVLLETCLRHDMQNTARDDGSIGLSKSSIALLSECAFRWRLSKEYRDVALFDLMLSFYRTGQIIEDDLFPKFKQISKAANNVRAWRVEDKMYYISILSRLSDGLHEKLRNFASMLGWKEKTPESCNSTMQLIALILSTLREDKAWLSEHPEWGTPGRLEELVREELLEAINARYRACSERVASLPREIIRLTISVKAVNSDITNYRLYFRDPIFELNIVLIAAETCLKYFLLEMENMRFSLKDDFAIGEMLDLYQAVKLLKDVSEESELPLVRNFDVESWFAPFISQWLALTDQKWLEWAKSAVDMEKYEPYMPPLSMHSTSVMDLFTCFYGGLDFIDKLDWKESTKKDRLVKDFVKMMSKSLQEYALMMWTDFHKIDNENSDKPFQFTPQSCIKLNNVVAALCKLDDILARLPSGDNPRSVYISSPPVGRRRNINRKNISRTAERFEPDGDKSVFSVTISRASNLPACDWPAATSDPYAVLEHAGTELHRTRVIPKTLNPAWNQTFELFVPNSLRDNESFLDITVYDHDVIGKDDVCTEPVSIFLRDSKFEDFLSHDLELQLKPHGTLNVRVLRHGEIDDIEWWVRKAEEGVKYVLEDIIRVCAEQGSQVDVWHHSVFQYHEHRKISLRNTPISIFQRK
ncbi:uncharacterized protein EV422DRAFT_7044 [Fimicolochytrium jonesii]|uniref:uncharacterized protein n=1 Tax=Fimicolochytrium jonesii TaxID=1396493 RepID=UPI0022FED9F3|nr:uncharacterized protein EV422DRAFT_7044 [Fimicolochytrium jonesii]KAI8826699.1 hypothetical protein EV422DRAFT_7044 [Fimicolochytrium jonesii]